MSIPAIVGNAILISFGVFVIVLVVVLIVSVIRSMK